MKTVDMIFRITVTNVPDKYSKEETINKVIGSNRVNIVENLLKALVEYQEKKEG